MDKSFRTGIVEYNFDIDGIETVSQMGCCKNYWTAFKEYGIMGQYIYVKRKDNKMIRIDKHDLSNEETEELARLLSENIKGKSWTVRDKSLNAVEYFIKYGRG